MAAALVGVGATVSATTTSTSTSTTTSTSNVTPEGFVSLKLTPHRVELDRRRRERRLGLAEQEAAGEELEVEVEGIYDEQSRRREDAVQIGALFEVRYKI